MININEVMVFFQSYSDLEGPYKVYCVNHKTEFNTESEPSDRIELSDNT